VDVPVTIQFKGEGGQLVFPSEGLYKVCAQVDVAFASDDYRAQWGAIPESNESNNIRCESVAVGPPRVYLPLMSRSAQ
jgi:hypothetical protein